MLRWRCTLCGECCKRYVPLVLPDDVRRIRDSLGRPIASFVTFFGPNDMEEPLPDTDPQFFITRHGKLALALSRQEHQPDGREGCIFLKNNACSIHGFSPYVCRQYPFRPVNEGDLDGPFRLMDDPCFGRHAEDQDVEEGPVRRHYREFTERESEYFARVRDWNSSPEAALREVEDFLSFVGLPWDGGAAHRASANLRSAPAPQAAAP